MTAGPSAEEAVERIERRLGVPLPQEYRDYVRAGLPWDPHRRFLRWEPGYSEWSKTVEIRAPHHFTERTPSSPTIEFMLDIFDGRQPGDGVIPKEAIAVASSPTLEEILLFVRGPRAGQVWLKHWKRLERENVDNPEDGLHFVANNFKEFLGKLRETEAGQ